MVNIKVTLEYDGTNYHGFQVQTKSSVPTVQSVLTEAVEKLTGETSKILGASRTDSGVHARGQVINFHTSTTIPPERMALALNGVLPADIVARGSQEVPGDFHARYSAVKKRYTYAIYNNSMPSALRRFYTYYVVQPLDEEQMALAAGYFIGKHDFNAFRASNPARDKETVRGNVREIYHSAVTREGSVIKLEIEGNGFLYNMVRIIAGTLIEVGRGKIKAGEIPLILAQGNRSLAGPTAPPQGLCLEKVFYAQSPPE